ncbi:Deoxyribose-phosphate aldolase, partial [hydrothermal vent metagenome]
MTTEKQILINSFPRVTGCDFHPGWVDEIRVNKSAVDRRISSLAGRRSVKKQWQAAWLLKAISCIDLTTLSGDDTPERVK